MTAPLFENTKKRQCFIHLFTGKGGVGKTVASAAWALAEANAGRKVLLVELHGRDRLGDLLQVGSVGYALREILKNVWIIDINPEDALKEYALLLLKFEPLYRLIFENKPVQNFLRLVPSLAELVMLGKIWYHSIPQKNFPDFDSIVIDAPATGHALGLLHAPSVVLKAAPPGILRSNTALILEMLIHPKTLIHLVTTPEEMPVNETILLYDDLAAAGFHFGRNIYNQLLPPLPASFLPLLQERMRSLSEKKKTAPYEADALGRLAQHHGQYRYGQQELQRLPKVLQENALILPHLAADPLGRQHVQQLASCLSQKDL